LLLHVVDLTGYYDTEPLKGFRTILEELDAHALSLAEKPQVILLNKIDAMPPAVVEEQREVFIAEVERLREGGHPAFIYLTGDETPPAWQLVWPVSAVTGEGLTALLRWVGPLLAKSRELDTERADDSMGSDFSLARGAESGDSETRHVVYRPSGTGERTFVVRREKTGFVVEGRAVGRLVSRFDLTNEEAIRYLGERLDRLGVYAALRAQGAQPGDDVDIEGYAFEFQ
jgi:GTPase